MHRFGHFLEEETRCTTRFFLLTEKEYSDDLHIKCERGGEVRELPVVKFEWRREGRGIDSRRAQKKTAVQYSCFCLKYYYFGTVQPVQDEGGLLIVEIRFSEDCGRS